MKISNNETINFKKAPTKKQKRNVKGTMASLAISGAAPAILYPVSIAINKSFPKASQGLNKADIALVNNAADEVLNNITNLGKKGVTITDYTYHNRIYLLPDFMTKIMKKIDPLNKVAEGKNACFVPKKACNIEANTILVNREKLPLPTFHELGHAFNFNNSSFWKFIQKTRTPLMYVGAMFALLPAFTKDAKAEDGKELTKKQKFKNGLRKASPILAGAAMLPLIAEEGMASIRGGKWAKQLLDKNLVKKVNKTNLLGFSTYLLSAAGFVLTGVVAKKIKDKSCEKLEK